MMGNAPQFAVFSACVIVYFQSFFLYANKTNSNSCKTAVIKGSNVNHPCPHTYI